MRNEMRKFQKIVLSVVLLSFLSFCVLPVNVWADKGGQETEEERAWKDIKHIAKEAVKEATNKGLESVKKVGEGVENLGKGITSIGKSTQNAADNARKKLNGEEKNKNQEQECNIFDPICKINQWLLELANFFLTEAVKMIAKIISYPKKVLDDPTIERYYKYFANTSWAFITTFTMYHLVRILSYYWINEDTQELKSLMVKLIVTVAMCGMYPSVFPYLVTITNNTTTSFANIGTKINQLSNIFLMIPVVGKSALIIMLLVLAIAILVVAFQVCLRSAELAFLFIAGPFAIATNLNNDINLFPAWWRSFLSLLITQVIQFVLLMIFVELFAGGILAGLAGFEKFIFGIGFAFLIIKSPSFIKEFIYSTGTSQIAINIASKTAGSVGSQISKQMLSKLIKK
jgi:hypothetical protein